MNTLILFLIFVLTGFSVMYITYKPQTDKYSQTLQFSYRMFPMPYIYAIFALGSVTAYFVSDNSDFVERLTFIRFLTPLIIAPIIYLACILSGRITATVITTIGIALTIFMQPIGSGNAYPEIAVWQLQLIVLIFSCIYCLLGGLNNFIPHTFIIPKVFIMLGLVIMAFLNSTPLYIALCAGILAGVLIAYLSINFYEVKIEIDNPTAITVSYMVCSLLLINLGELCFPSCIILTAVFWAELLVAIWRRIFITRAGSLTENTNYYLAAQNISIKAMVLSLFKICTIIMFLAWFQLYSINGYSLFLIALCIALWLNGSMVLPNGGKRSLGEINREFISNIKQGIKETTDLLNKKRKDD